MGKWKNGTQIGHRNYRLLNRYRDSHHRPNSVSELHPGHGTPRYVIMNARMQILSGCQSGVMTPRKSFELQLDFLALVTYSSIVDLELASSKISSDILCCLP